MFHALGVGTTPGAERSHVARPAPAASNTPPVAPREFAPTIHQQIALFDLIGLGEVRAETHRCPDADGLGSLFFAHAALTRAYRSAPKLSFVDAPTDARFLDLYDYAPHFVPFEQGNWLAAVCDAHDRTSPNVRGFRSEFEAHPAAVAWDHHRRVVNHPLYLVSEDFKSAGVPVFYFVEQLFRAKGISLELFCREHPKLCMLLALGIMIDEQADFGKVIASNFDRISPLGTRVLRYLLGNSFFDATKLLDFDITREAAFLHHLTMAKDTHSTVNAVRLACGDVVPVHTAWVCGDSSVRSYAGACANALLDSVDPRSLVFLFHYVPRHSRPGPVVATDYVPSIRAALDDQVFCSVRKREPMHGGCKVISAAEIANLMNGDGGETSAGFCMNPLRFSGLTFAQASAVTSTLVSRLLASTPHTKW